MFIYKTVWLGDVIFLILFYFFVKEILSLSSNKSCHVIRICYFIKKGNLMIYFLICHWRFMNYRKCRGMSESRFKLNLMFKYVLMMVKLINDFSCCACVFWYNLFCWCEPYRNEGRFFGSNHCEAKNLLHMEKLGFLPFRWMNSESANAKMSSVLCLGEYFLWHFYVCVNLLNDGLVMYGELVDAMSFDL